MRIKLTDKAQRLYDYIREKGGGVIEEWRICDKTGMSHGSFVAARKELVAAGLLLLGKKMRKTTYQLVELTGQKMTRQKPAAVPPLPPSKEGLAPTGSKGRQKTDKPSIEVQEAIMPRVVGDFADFDDWMLALNEALGDCVDVSQSLVSSSEYIVFSSEYGGEDSYTVSENEYGGVTVE